MNIAAAWVVALHQASETAAWCCRSSPMPGYRSIRALVHFGGLPRMAGCPPTSLAPARPDKWHKLHLVVDADSDRIVAQTLTDQDADDPSQVVPLLDQIDSPIAQVTADGAYDGGPTYQTIATHGDTIEVVIPPA
jgi:hypothetical protein